MEPLFFKAENRTFWRRIAGARSPFNGAAFFQSGKSEYSTAALAALEWTFNGAAFFQSGKWSTIAMHQF